VHERERPKLTVPGSFPTLETERLLLRRIVPEDAPALFEFRSDPQVQRYNGGPLAHVEQAAELVALFEAGFQERTRVEWGVTLKGGDDQVIGDVGYAHWSQLHRQAEIGYCLSRCYWRQGIATEALVVILRFGFEEMDLHRIHACPWAENVASVRVLEKLGFRKEGIRRDEYWADRAFHDEALYALLRPEYFR
jgi:RimJ/RimL family protein N-acetyltransferase